MALADLKLFFKEFERDHIERRNILEEANKIAETSGMPEEIITQLRDTFQRDDKEYQLLAYCMWLLELPKRESKKSKMLKKDEKLVTKFSEFGLDRDSIRADNEEVVNNFRQYINNLKEQE